MLIGLLTAVVVLVRADNKCYKGSPSDLESWRLSTRDLKDNVIYCGWRLTEPCSENMTIANNHFPMSPNETLDGKCQVIGNKTIQCYCLGNNCNTDVELLHKILMTTYIDLFPTIQTSTAAGEISVSREPNDNETIMYCALTELDRQFHLPKGHPPKEMLTDPITVKEAEILKNATAAPGLLPTMAMATTTGSGSELESEGFWKPWIIGIFAAAAFLLLVGGAIGVFKFWRRWKRRRLEQEEYDEDDEAEDEDVENEPLPSQKNTNVEPLASGSSQGGSSLSADPVQSQNNQSSRPVNNQFVDGVKALGSKDIGGGEDESDGEPVGNEASNPPSEGKQKKNKAKGNKPAKTTKKKASQNKGKKDTKTTKGKKKGGAKKSKGKGGKKGAKTGGKSKGTGGKARRK